eukprot:2716100-Rhodomonas_salina.1
MVLPACGRLAWKERDNVEPASYVRIPAEGLPGCYAPMPRYTLSGTHLAYLYIPDSYWPSASSYAPVRTARCLYQRVWVPGWEETNPFLIRFLMERVWNMPKPRLVFSVNSATFLRVSYALSGTDRIEFGFG